MIPPWIGRPVKLAWHNARSTAHRTSRRVVSKTPCHGWQGSQGPEIARPAPAGLGLQGYREGLYVVLRIFVITKFDDVGERQSGKEMGW